MFKKTCEELSDISEDINYKVLAFLKCNKSINNFVDSV